MLLMDWMSRRGERTPFRRRRPAIDGNITGSVITMLCAGLGSGRIKGSRKCDYRSERGRICGPHGASGQ